MIISSVFFIFSTMVNEANTQYGNQTSINASAWSSRYDFADTVNSSLAPVVDRWAKITDENQGFFTRIAAGITAIPFAIIVLPIAILSGLVIMLGQVIVGFMTALSLPARFILYVSIMLIIWVVFKLASFFQRVDV